MMISIPSGPTGEFLTASACYPLPYRAEVFLDAIDVLLGQGVTISGPLVYFDVAYDHIFDGGDPVLVMQDGATPADVLARWRAVVPTDRVCQLVMNMAIGGMSTVVRLDVSAHHESCFVLCLHIGAEALGENVDRMECAARVDAFAASAVAMFRHTGAVYGMIAIEDEIPDLKTLDDGTQPLPDDWLFLGPKATAPGGDRDTLIPSTETVHRLDVGGDGSLFLARRPFSI